MENQSGQDNIWPAPVFYFSVIFSSLDNAASFREVSGLEAETKETEYRHDKPISPVKIPAFVKKGQATLKKGIFVNNSSFRNWCSAIKMNTVQPETVIIKLLDEKGKPTVTWTLSNALVTKISGTDLEADGNEAAVESIEMSYEFMTIINN